MSWKVGPIHKDDVLVWPIKGVIACWWPEYGKLITIATPDRLRLYTADGESTNSFTKDIWICSWKLLNNIDLSDPKGSHLAFSFCPVSVWTLIGVCLYVWSRTDWESFVGRLIILTLLLLLTCPQVKKPRSHFVPLDVIFGRQLCNSLHWSMQQACTFSNSSQSVSLTGISFHFLWKRCFLSPPRCPSDPAINTSH